MSFLNYTTSFTKNDDGSSVFTINMDETMTKCLTTVCNDPEHWICNAVHNRCRIEGERIYKSELEKHIEANTMPENPTKQSLILSYEIPIETVTETP